MGKKSSSRKDPAPAPAPAPAPVENSGVGGEKPSSCPKKRGNEIDEIFAGKKRKKPEKGVEDGKQKVDKLKKEKKIKDKEKRKEAKENGSAEAPSGRRKKTADGLTIYTEEELGIGNPNAGGTPSCPFDCDCCF